jgi:phosphate binding protein
MKSTISKILGLALILAVMLPVGGIFAQDGTVVDVIAGSSDHVTLSTAISLAGLDATLADTGAEYTVFAPVDAAFASLPAEVFNAALADSELLTSVLTYHVVEGKSLSSDLADGCSDVPTVNGASLTICNDMGVVTVNSATVTAADLEAGNGVVHVIDAVVVPPVELPAIDPVDYEGDIITAGSSTVFPLSVDIASRWNEEGGVDTPTVESIGSGAGFSRFCEAGETDISNASRPIKAEEIASCATIGRTPIEFRVGTDALAVTVSAENDFVDDLSIEQLAMIFSGEAATWADVNPEWPAEEIQIFSPGTDSGTFDYFVEVVLEEDEEALLGADPQLSENDDVLVEGVAGSPYAIGYFGYAYYTENTDILKILSINGVTANAQTVDSNEYPLARPLFIYSDATIMAEKPQVAAFIAYYLNVVNEEISDVGYFPAAPDALNLSRLQLLIAAGDILE